MPTPIDTTIRTNITPDGYDFGGVTYKKEARLDGQGNSYTVDVAQTPAAVVTNPIPGTGTVPTPTGAPTAATIGDIYGGAALGKAEQDYQKYLDNPDAYLEGQGISVSALKNKTLAEMQAQIDATNAIYATKLREARIQGNATLGSSTAIQGRRGLLGSDFGESITKSVEGANQDIYDTIEAEKAMKINDIMTQAQTKAEERFKEAKAAKEAGLKSYVENLKGKSTQIKTGANEAAAALVAAGLDPSTLTSEQLTQFLAGYGTNKEALTEAYKLSKLTSDQSKKAAEAKRKQDLEDDIAKELAKPVTLSEGGMLVDPKTGKTLKYNPKTFAPKDGDGVGSAVSPQTTSTNLKNLIGTAQKAIDLSNAAGPNWFTKTGGDVFIGDSEFRQLEALTDAVRTNLLTLNTDPAIKKFFGPQMSNPDVTLMTSAATPLNVQKMTPAQVKDYITQAQDVFVRAKKAVDAANGISEAPGAKMVTVQLPDGRTGSIPEANVQAAVAKGAKVIQ